MTEKAQANSIISRRSLLAAAATLTTSAALSPAASALSPAPRRPTLNSPFAGKYHPIVASASKNVVETDTGKIYGYARDGVVGYRGIPYGATTEGAGRFMPPLQPKPWAGVRSALYWGAASPSSVNSSVKGRRPGWAHDDQAFMFEWDDGQPSEDCLRLNVWTPALDNHKRAVMLFIHGGGGMTYGSSNEVRAYDGENLARSQDVVVVTINHRLGALGFLNLMEYGDPYTASPNVSMLDIIQALTWVRTNISNFGGDPGRVMIFGQAGGSAKVGILMGIPAAKGLFHRASIQSGSDLPRNAAETSAKLAHATLAELGVSRDTIGKLHTDFTFRQIVQAGLIAQAKVPNANWWPVEDGSLIQNITWNPAAPQASATVPLIVGSVLNEANNSVQMGDASLESIDLAEATRRLTRLMGVPADHVVDVTRKLHPKATPFEVFSRAATMRDRGMSAYKQAGIKARQGAAPAYLYRFEWQSPMCDGRARAFHYGELPFCFQNAALCAKLTGNTPDAHQLSARVAGAWAAFAKTGNPNHPGIPNWEPFNDSVPTLRFDTECVSTNDPDGEMRKAILESMAQAR